MTQSEGILSSPSTFGHLSKTVLVAFALLIVAACATFFVLSMLKPYMGLALSLEGQDWTVQSVDANGAAYQVGIRVGDKPVEVNGQPSEIFLARYKEAKVVSGYLVRELSVADERGQLRSAALKNASPSVQAMVEPMAWLFVSVVFWSVGFYVFAKRQNNIAALVLCVSGLVFGLALSATLAANRGISAMLVFAIAAPIFGPWLLLHFFLVLPEERKRLRSSPLTYLLYLPPAITLLFFFLIGYADGQPVQWFRTVRFLEAATVFVVTICVAILNFLRAASVRTRQQMKVVSLSCLVALIPLVVLNVLPSGVWGQPILPGTISILFIAFVPMGMGYAVVTQKLMDIDVIIRRGVIYGLVSTMMALILSAAIFPILAFRKLVGVPEVILIALILGAFATLLFGPAKRAIEDLVDRLLYKDRYDYKQIVQNVSEALNLAGDSTEVCRLVVATTVRALNLAGAALFLKSQPGSAEVGATEGIYNEPNRQQELMALLTRHNPGLEFPSSAASALPDLAYLIPLAVAEREVGVLFASPKRNRQDFSSDDLFLLQGLASIAAMALHRTMLIRDVSLRDTFVSVASHELRTPLTSILGYADLLLRRNPPDATRRRWLQNVLDNTKRVAAMVDDLLNVSRIQSGRVTMKLVKTGLLDILTQLLSVAKEGTDKHEFVTEIAPDLPDVMVDTDKLGQVIGNLLSNAVKYSPSGGRITLSARNDRERQQVVVGVSDQGIGIGSEDKCSLFTTFHRIQRPETQGIKGSGLGLYIAKEWTEAMGGNIWVESELNKGSTFFVGIPLKDSGEVS